MRQETRLNDSDLRILEQLVDNTLDAFRSGRIDRNEARTILMRALTFIASGNAYVASFAEKLISELFG